MASSVVVNLPENEGSVFNFKEAKLGCSCILNSTDEGKTYYFRVGDAAKFIISIFPSHSSVLSNPGLFVNDLPIVRAFKNTMKQIQGQPPAVRVILSDIFQNCLTCIRYLKAIRRLPDYPISCTP